MSRSRGQSFHPHRQYSRACGDRTLGRTSIDHGRTSSTLGIDLLRRFPTHEASPDQIVRCGRGTWALAEWGEEEWTTIFDLINRRIDESKTGAALEDLNARRRSVWDYHIVRSSRTPRPNSSSKTDGASRGADESPRLRYLRKAWALYRRDGKWSLLVTVTRGHLRGFRSQIPSGWRCIVDSGGSPSDAESTR